MTYCIFYIPAWLGFRFIILHVHLKFSKIIRNNKILLSLLRLIKNVLCVNIIVREGYILLKL